MSTRPLLAVLFALLNCVAFSLPYVPLELATQSENSRSPANCPSEIDVEGDSAYVSPPHAKQCHVQTRNSTAFPDPSCTPGAFNPSVTLSVLKNPDFKTGCLRNHATTEGEKNATDKDNTYDYYGIPRNMNSQGHGQVCELDHFIPLYLGGADTLDNIWPQCGPTGASGENLYFKKKDKVEVYLGDQVRAGKMTLPAAREGIVKDWTQYSEAARDYCASNKCGDED